MVVSLEYLRQLQTGQSSTQTLDPFRKCSISQPFTVLPDGRVESKCNVELIKANVQQIIMTLCQGRRNNGEIPWRPEFGTLVSTLRFRNNNFVLRELAEEYIVDALERWEPRVEVKQANILSVDSLLSIHIIYDILLNPQSGNILQSNIDQQFTI